MRSRRAATAAIVSLTGLLLASTPAEAIGGGGTNTGSHGGTKDKNIYASATYSRIKVRQVSGPTGGKRGRISSVDVNWKPPACWYEPVFTGEGLKNFVDRTDGNGDVGIHEAWFGKELWTDHYRDGKPETNFDDAFSTAEGYKDYNIGKNGYFWRSVAPDDTDPDSWDCGRIMFWQDAGEIPRIPHAPTPKTLAEYAYNQVQVPDTETELKPSTKSTVNLPTWVWLDQGTFRDIKVRAELPGTGLWAETTAKPVSLHLDPGTEDAETYPASGDCTFKDDGSIGTPYAKGDADRTPPCGIRYLRATSGTPYHLKASVTWKITWVGTGGAEGDLPDGTFETTQDMDVQEIQSVNR
ncbi:hypothetical protein [Streptomyces brasiliensis]|uniref:Secreted protein n=1 Tax=Streptomyces brasiliensis TaxID=1954 RepID=A0A917LBB7_9ACTN|nr:hypothetical protein [Streptomyces brasiliensis]GGJ52352.1 hypothetical protein GCM10010121_073960 [Streptomyces brasiliensis]